EKLLVLLVSLDGNVGASGHDGSRLSRRQFVGTVVVSKLFRIGLSRGGIFVVAMCLAGDDLPIAVALEPGVSDVITRLQILAEDRLGLVGVVTEYGGVADNPTLDVLDLNRSGIPCRHRRDVGDQFWFVEKASLLVGEDAVLCEIFFPRRLIAGDDGVVKLLCAMDQFVLCDRNIRSAGDGYGGEKCNEREFHNTSLFHLHTSAFSLTRSLQPTTRPCVSDVRC